MPNTYNLYNLEPQFKTFLLAENVSSLTLTNYLSDFRHFAAWFEAKINKQATKELFDLITFDVINQYKYYLFESRMPQKTISRRLSTLRKLCSFAIQQGWLKDNPAKKVQNATNCQTITDISKLNNLLDEYQSYLLNTQGKESRVVENNLTIIKEFFSL